MITTRRSSICHGILLLTLPAFSAFAAGETFDRYALPRDKRTTDACRKVALAAHPGKVHQMSPRNTIEGFQYRFEIEDPDRMTWAVVCDAATQRIVTNQLIQ